MLWVTEVLSETHLLFECSRCSLCTDHPGVETEQEPHALPDKWFEWGEEGNVLKLVAPLEPALEQLLTTLRET